MKAPHYSLDVAILGRLVEGPSHGYALRAFFASRFVGSKKLSYGTLYPALRRLMAEGLICDCQSSPMLGRKRRIYHVTEAGERYLTETVGEVVPGMPDDAFYVRFPLFHLIEPKLRLAILDERRASVESRWREATQTAHPQEYPRMLQRHLADIYHGEIDWLDALISAEKENLNKEKKWVRSA